MSKAMLLERLRPAQAEDETNQGPGSDPAS